jgi:hypothetical protein
MRTLLSFLSVVALAVATGCDGGVSKAKVSGTVNFDGASVDEGSLNFTPVEKGKGEPTVTPITNGHYSVDLVPGNYKVAVYWPKKASGKPGADPYQETGERIPPQYNQKTTLTLDVPSGGVEKNWDLKK